MTKATVLRGTRSKISVTHRPNEDDGCPDGDATLSITAVRANDA